MGILRKIIVIDEEKCDGCGICADACHEGAIAIVEEKARLIRDSYCDGLGDCIGECPQNAISFEERIAEAYDEVTVKARMAARKTAPCSCPSSLPKQLAVSKRSSDIEAVPALSNWPVQLRLAPVHAPYFDGAQLLLAADCTAFATAELHTRYLPGKICLVGCPKLDDSAYYTEKLTEILTQNSIQSLDVLYMEVPCCGGLVAIAQKALAACGKSIPLNLVKLGLNGERK